MSTPANQPAGKGGDNRRGASQGPRLSVWKKLLFSVIAVVLFFGVMEGALALLGVRPVPYEKDPYVGFSSYFPLFVEKTAADGRTLMVTAKNKLRLFNPQQFPKIKPPGAFRIFSVGGSTTYGRPFDDATSFTGWLRAYLNALAPHRKWEVINAGGVSYASYRVARLMEELIHYQPDLFIIYSGQNEFLEQRTYGKIKSMPESVMGLGAFLDRSRVVTVLKKGIDYFRRLERRKPPHRTILSGEVITKLDNSVGPSAYHRDDHLKAQILKDYRFNLARMIDIARSVGAKVILVTPASNLRGISPFKSQHRSGLNVSELKRWNRWYLDAQKALGKKEYQSAFKDLKRAEAIDDRYADLFFLEGRALEALGRYAEAKRAYQRARDEDICPLRALTPMPGIVEQVARERHVPCVDFVAIQDARAPHGIPGREDFFDHVHPTIESHRLLAVAILKTMQKEGMANPDWNPKVMAQVTLEIKGRINTKMQAVALMNLSKVLGWAGKLDAAYQLAQRAVRKDPTNARADYQAGLCAQILGNTRAAIAYYRRTVDLDPTAAAAQGNLGFALEAQGDLQDAIRHYQLAIQYGDPADVARNRRNLERARKKLAGLQAARQP